MAATPESKVKAKVRAWLQERSIWYCQPIGSAFGPSGVPDIIACWKGRALGIEVKAPGKRSNTTTMQERQLAQITASGGIAIVVDDVSQLDEMEVSLG